MRVDRVKTSLVKPYEGPFKVIESGHKVYKLEIRGKFVYVSIDRLKPAFLAATDENTTMEPSIATSRSTKTNPADEAADQSTGDTRRV